MNESAFLRSPLDGGATVVCQDLVQINTEKPTRWKPSQFNARTVDDQGSLILWNTFSTAISYFTKDQRPRVEALLSHIGSKDPLDEIGLYLASRGFIVRSSASEFQQFRQRFGEQHYSADTLELILLASEDCNFRCSYCYEDFSRGTMLPEVRHRIKSYLTTRGKALNNVSIQWFGGEPLYGFDAIEDLSTFLLEGSRSYGWNYRAAMTTNGYLLSPARADRLLAWKINKFQITLDGVECEHDHKRPTRDGGDTFHVIFTNLQALHARSDEFEVVLRTNVDQNNAPRLGQYLELLAQTFGSDKRFKLMFRPVGKWGGPQDDSLATCGRKDARAIRRQFDSRALDLGLTPRTILDSNVFGGGACYAARPFNFIIGADGKLMKCTIALDKQSDNVVGFLSDGGRMVFDESKLARWVNPAFEDDGLCQSCHMLPHCQGLSCPLIRTETGHSPCEATIKDDIHGHLVTAASAKRQTARRKNVTK